MDLEVFYADFLNSVQLRVASAGGFTDDAFAEAASERLIDANEISTFEPCHYRAPNGRIGIDGYCFDEADDSLRVFIVHRSGSDGPNRLTKTEAEAHFRKLIAFVDTAFTGRFDKYVDENHPARDLAERAFEERDRLSRIRAYLLSDCLLSSRVKDWPEGTVGSVPIDYHIWDLGRFYRAAMSKPATMT